MSERERERERERESVCVCVCRVQRAMHARGATRMSLSYGKSLLRMLDSEERARKGLQV